MTTRSCALRFRLILQDAALAPALALALACAGPSPSAWAVDTSTTTTAPDLASIRAKIKAGDYEAAKAELLALVDRGVQHADVYNLLAFSLRNSGDPRKAATYYQKALEFDPDHRGALEYQGELFVQTGQLAEARANLARLRALCPQGCEERADLERALGAAGERKS